MLGWGMSIFGGGSSRNKDVPKNAILRLRSTKDMLTKREKHLRDKIDIEEASARKFVNSNKDMARAALRRKKAIEEDLTKTNAQIFNIESQIAAIESANINKETLDAFNEAGQAFKHIHAGMDIAKVDKMMADLEDQHAISDEISQALTQGPVTTAVDEDELDEELAALQQEDLDEKMLKTGTVPVADQVHGMPNAVRGELPSSARNKQTVEDEEEAELERLKAEFAM